MNWELILTSGAISGFIGIIVKLLADKQTKKLELKLLQDNKAFEIRLNSLVERQRSDYNLLIESLRNIWKQFSIIENHFILEMSNNFVYDPQWKVIRAASHEIRNQMLFLPDSIYDSINDFLNKIFEVYIQNYVADTQKLIIKNNLLGVKQIGQTQYPELFIELNRILQTLQGGFWKGKDELRKTIRDKAQEIYSGKNDKKDNTYHY